MKIGIIGSGNIGGTLAQLWVEAGHEVILSSRHPQKLIPLAHKLGKNAKVGTPEEAARLGEIVLLSIPLGEIPKLSKTIVASLADKIVMDTCNPYPERDGPAGVEALRAAEGSGEWVAHHLPGAIVVKAFNSVYYKTLQSEAHRKFDPIGIPLASNDVSAIAIVENLVREAGFGPVVVGKLQRAKEFDHGTPPYASDASVRELKKLLQIE
jgi:predicted dinucleotide-binding enzyme